ncbi:rhodanese-like domain-containing protein [Albimonas sp. CAU 1670]|uniref:sulfurtransferase n=1 Tax=Albimonas sp. CAU 1670 TaxID=3032599 RepID=UPI0023DC1517|nr:rhodanese-like domain-containing protein [Albimonas sp. CAU 1670]MDF2235043.1 rhodanese-like domain-containing protein [Albimonas sp. CAU 1670]
MTQTLSNPSWRRPEAIVDGAGLQARLGDPDLRIYDCTVYLRYEVGTGRPYRVESGRADWEAGHIPGARFLDLQEELSQDDAPTRFMRRSAQATADAFARVGVGEGTRVVLYSRGTPQWATRVWWMLRWIGFDDAAILDGGFDLWEAEGRPVSTEPVDYPEGRLVAKERPGLFVGKEEMLAAIGDGAVCSLNALSPDLHSGENARYGRPGRIPGSTNVPAGSLVDPQTKRLVSPRAAAEAFAAAGATPEKRVLNYCGGGIAATLDAFLQHQLGYEDVAVYDASMSEWAKDERLPIEVG